MFWQMLIINKKIQVLQEMTTMTWSLCHFARLRGKGKQTLVEKKKKISKSFNDFLSDFSDF